MMRGPEIPWYLVRTEHVGAEHKGRGVSRPRWQEVWRMKGVMVTATDRMRALETEHRALDERLKILSRRAFLTPDEQREAAELKRKKLFAKDRLFALARADARTGS